MRPCAVTLKRLGSISGGFALEKTLDLVLAHPIKATGHFDETTKKSEPLPLFYLRADRVVELPC